MNCPRPTPSAPLPAVRSFRALATATGVLVLLMSGCASPDKARAPVEERQAATRPAARPARGASAPVGATPPAAGAAGAGAAPAATGSADAPAKPPPPGIENAGKPGYYSVRPGDTLIRIGLENGQSWRDIARWNALENPNLIEVGQVLRVVPPGVDPGQVSARGVAPSRVEVRPLDARAAGTPAPAPATAASAPGPAASAPAAAPSGSAASASPAAAAAREDDEPPWQWPAAGALVGSFEEGRTRGVLIGGKAGDPVLAAADGRVIYAGSALRGYGNLIIVKHNGTYLTAYAHNQALLVKEDQPVRRGQKIAEMGATDADRVQLHFEIRRQGKPVDPLKLLPSR